MGFSSSTGSPQSITSISSFYQSFQQFLDALKGIQISFLYLRTQYLERFLFTFGQNNSCFDFQSQFELMKRIAYSFQSWMRLFISIRFMKLYTFCLRITGSFLLICSYAFSMNCYTIFLFVGFRSTVELQSYLSFSNASTQSKWSNFFGSILADSNNFSIQSLSIFIIIIIPFQFRPFYNLHIMLTLLLRAKMSQQFKPKDRLPFAKNYVFYDQLINEFNKSNGKLSTKTMETFLIGSVPKITRRQTYLPTLTNIFKSAIPHFTENFEFYKSKFLFSTILIIYQTLNIHRKQIFELVEKSIPSFDDLRIKHCQLYYYAIVDLHHKENPELKRKIKQHLFNEITHDKFVQRNPYKSNHLLFAIKILNLMLMDHETNLDQCQVVINSIEKNIFPTVKNVSLLENDAAKNFALAKELIFLHKLKINNENFYQLLDSAMVFFIDQKMQLSKPVTRRQNFDIELHEGKEMEFRGSGTAENRNQVNHGVSSIFETIFSRCLDQLGYDYDKNAFIGMFEYDFMIKGKKSKKYLPFQTMSQNPTHFKPITPNQWQTFKSMQNHNHIKTHQPYKQPVILNLNGPYHYIDSNVYGNERVTRTDEIKMLLLKNYGYERFNEVYYAEWEEVHEKGVFIEEYIRKVVDGGLVVRK